MPSAPRAFALALLVPLVLFGQAHAQPALHSQPQLARPWATGVHCPLLLPCADSDDTAVHLLYRLTASLPVGASAAADMAIGGTIGASVTIARWAEAGMTVAGYYEKMQGRISGPFTLWARLTPPALSALGSDYLHQGFSFAAEVREDIGTPPVDGGGSLFPDALAATLILQERKDRLLLLGVGGLDLAGKGSYRGGHVGAGLWLMLYRGDVHIQVGGEVLAQLPGPGAPQVSLAAGLRFYEDKWGIGTTAGYVHHGSADPLAWSVLIGGGMSFGGHHISNNPAWLFAPLHYWMAGFRDPVVAADGWIYSDDHKEKLYFYGFPDPKDPSRILPARDSRGEALRVGQHVLVDPDSRDIRSDDYAYLGHAGQRCGLNMNMPAPGEDGLTAAMAGAVPTNYVSCGQTPSLNTWVDVAGLMARAMLGRQPAAAASSGGPRPPPRWSFFGSGRPSSKQESAIHDPPPAKAQRALEEAVHQEPPRTRVTGADLEARRRAFKSAKPGLWQQEAETHPNKYTSGQLADMKRGDAPTDAKGLPMEIHHKTPLAEGGSNDITNMAFMTWEEHRAGGNFKLNHPNLWKK